MDDDGCGDDGGDGDYDWADWCGRVDDDNADDECVVLLMTLC